MDYSLLTAFRGLFEGQRYKHRNPTLGDSVAKHLFEDLYALDRSPKYTNRVDSRLSVLSKENRRRGVSARRGDGSFGEAVPNSNPIREEGFNVARGEIATIEIGVEVKIMMKAMKKQIDRVMNDLHRQAAEFRTRGGNSICVGIVGVNRARYCITYEGDQPNPTNGRNHKHPIDEANAIEERLRQEVDTTFDELLILRFEATNEAPYHFSWDEQSVQLEYGAALVRLSQKYEKSM